MSTIKLAYKTKYGRCYQGDVNHLFEDKAFKKYKNKINLILTSPPFPLNRKKKYGNLNGEAYIDWLTEITTKLREYLAEDGSFVLEIGNAWEKGEPLMSTLPMETLLAIKKQGDFKLCQQFVWFNTAKLPSPVQWVNIDRIRVKDSFTTIWWLSKQPNPKANNIYIIEDYSKAMKKLFETGKYNAGKRPSEHNIGKKSFLIDNGGAIPSNVLVGANTISNSTYISRCKDIGLIPHPARMPYFIAEYFINFLTVQNDIVFDPFAGSNTTGATSELLKRKWISIEIDEGYVNGSKHRFE